MLIYSYLSSLYPVLRISLYLANFCMVLMQNVCHKCIQVKPSKQNTGFSCKFHQSFDCTVLYLQLKMGPVCGCKGWCMCACPRMYAFVFFLSFVFLHRGANAPSKFPSYFLTYTSPSALVPIC